MAQGQPAMTDNTCSACQGSWPKEDHFIDDLGLSKAYLHDDQFFHGWTVVVFKRHATELFHLAPTERIILMEEVNLVAKVVARVYEARKINYELLGNHSPHPLACHSPTGRRPGPLEPVWRVQHEPILSSGLDLQSTVQRLQQAIQNAR